MVVRVRSDCLQRRIDVGKTVGEIRAPFRYQKAPTLSNYLRVACDHGILGGGELLDVSYV